MTFLSQKNYTNEEVFLFLIVRQIAMNYKLNTLGCDPMGQLSETITRFIYLAIKFSCVK